MNKQQLANKIWESANKMRSKIEANEYKDYILGFIFYKFLSDKEVKYLKEMQYWEDEDIRALSEENTDDVKQCQDGVGYFISYDNLFSTWINKGADFDVSNVRDALSAFSRLIKSTHEKVFSGIFDTLQTGLSKLGDSAASQTKAIRDLLYLIKDIPMDGKQDYDVLGFIYEYLISNFAANAGKKAGEFYTPHEVSLLMSEIVAGHLKDKNEIEIYDPTSGSGSLLINIGKSVSKYMGNGDNIKYYAQELKQNTYNLTRMNLVMRGIIPDNIFTRCADTLEDDWPYFDESDPINTYKALRVDAVVSNPPYSQVWDPSNKEVNPRFREYGVAPKGKADYAFLLHDLYHVKKDGLMTIVLPHGVLFRGGEEGIIRKNLIEKNNIDTIIGLPANIFFGTGIPTIIMVLKQYKENSDVLIIDASKGFEKQGKNNVLRACDIKKIVDTVEKRKSVEGFSKLVSRDEIRKNDYNLNIPRYVDSSEKAESWDIYASMFGGIPKSEVDEYKEYWTALNTLKCSIFADTDKEYLYLNTEDIKKDVLNDESVKAFILQYQNAFEGFDKFLYSELIDSVQTVEIPKEESVLSGSIFERLENVSLVDPYVAYQLLDDEWKKIAVDLEIIQTEGFNATKQVDANMVLKKKNGKNIEVQEGWVGHVLPFDLVQKYLLPDELAELEKMNARVSEIASEYEELLDSLPEEEKDKDFVNDDKTAFVSASVKKTIKANDAEPEILEILRKYDKLDTEEKTLKRDIKTKAAELIEKTKTTIENLSDEQVRELLEQKWIIPIMEGLKTLAGNLIGEFTSKLDNLSKKYIDTLQDIENDINATEAELCNMFDDLTGNDFDICGISELKKLFGGEV